MAEHTPAVETSKELIFDTLINVKESLVGVINEFIFAFTPENPVAFVFIISVLLGITITRWKKESKTYGVVAILLIFFSLRFLKIGG